MSLGLALPVPGPSASQLDTGAPEGSSSLESKAVAGGPRQPATGCLMGPTRLSRMLTGSLPAEDSHLETRSTKVWATAVTFS